MDWGDIYGVMAVLAMALVLRYHFLAWHDGRAAASSRPWAYWRHLTPEGKRHFRNGFAWLAFYVLFVIGWMTSG